MNGNGNTKVRLVDIAAEAGVSRAVVGQVLNRSGGTSVRVSEATRERVLKIAKRLNYRPNRAAQQLRGKPTRMFGVILDTVNLPVFSARLSAIEAEAHRRRFRLVIGQVHHDSSAIQEYLDDFADRGIDGVLCLFDVMRDIRSDLSKVFEERPSVVIHAAPVIDDQPCVRVDTESAISMLIEHLVQRGRKKIGLSLWSLTDELMQLRKDVWERVLTEHGLEVSEDLLWVNPAGVQKPTSEAIDECIVALVKNQGVDAIVSSNDMWAVRLVQALRRHGYQVPQDVAVTGYDNLDISEIIEPGVTTIDQCHESYAVAALDLLEASLKGEIPAEIRNRVIAPKLVVREST
ncbi:LacI family DNA-binding transcriptional regulator [Calycomorphotria hydatis]|uniref:HTH-type transcriptional regulator DegA n=1 Tax=Calycomorphotria hydatis TaxID=2528027 RepID=A0A517TDF1_9PLAN|nr:LacI family DNA-binding transcriptional regulator [Calycomorphotria hydatis]QDT66406.1 HTH-type transcriptional regulator DegA [Calycomorphotria hydatis]